MSERKLTPLEQRFLEEYPKDFCASHAARRAGYAGNNPSQRGYQLYSKLHSEIEALKRDSIRTIKIEREELLEELKRLALSPNHRDLAKIKALEMLTKYLGIIDGQGADRRNPENANKRLSELVRGYRDRLRNEGSGNTGEM